MIRWISIGATRIGVIAIGAKGAGTPSAGSNGGVISPVFVDRGRPTAEPPVRLVALTRPVRGPNTVLPPLAAVAPPGSRCATNGGRCEGAGTAAAGGVVGCGCGAGFCATVCVGNEAGEGRQTRTTTRRATTAPIGTKRRGPNSTVEFFRSRRERTRRRKPGLGSSATSSRTTRSISSSIVRLGYRLSLIRIPDCRELSLQNPTRLGNSPLHRADRRTEHLRDLVVRVFAGSGEQQ